MNHPQTILTGDRPTGQLHLGHYVGSLRQRVALQHNHQQFILIADLQGLTDNGSNPQKNQPPYPRSHGRLSGRRHRPRGSPLFACSPPCRRWRSSARCI